MTRYWRPAEGVPVILAQDVEMEPSDMTERIAYWAMLPQTIMRRRACADILARHFGIEPCHTMVIQGKSPSAMDWGGTWDSMRIV